MEDEKKDIEKDKKDYERVLIFYKFSIIFGMFLIVVGTTDINDSGGGVIFLGLMMVLMGSCLWVGQKKDQEMLGKKQSSQEIIQIDKKITKKFSIKIFIEKIRKKVKTIFSNVCSILSSPITTNVILIIIVCMLSGIKCSVVNYHLSSYSITSAIKDALDDYGFIQVRRY